MARNGTFDFTPQGFIQKFLWDWWHTNDGHVNWIMLLIFFVALAFWISLRFGKNAKKGQAMSQGGFTRSSGGQYYYSQK